MIHVRPSWISDWNPEDKKFWDSKGKDCPAQSHLVDRCRAYRLFGLADLEHRRDQAAAGRLSLHDRSTVSARGAARPDRLAHAVSLHVRGHDLRRPQLDDLQRVGAVHPDHRARLFRGPSRDAVLADDVGGGDGGSRRRQLRFQHDQHFLLLSGPHEGLGARLERGRRQYRCQQRAVVDADPDGRRPHQSLPGDAGRRRLSSERGADVDACR